MNFALIRIGLGTFLFFPANLENKAELGLEFQRLPLTLEHYEARHKGEFAEPRALRYGLNIGHGHCLLRS